MGWGHRILDVLVRAVLLVDDADHGRCQVEHEGWLLQSHLGQGGREGRFPINVLRPRSHQVAMRRRDVPQRRDLLAVQRCNVPRGKVPHHVPVWFYGGQHVRSVHRRPGRVAVHHRRSGEPPKTSIVAVAEG